MGYKVRDRWSHRLTVRTPGSHPGNPGSIPGEITKEEFFESEGSFLVDMTEWRGFRFQKSCG